MRAAYIFQKLGSLVPTAASARWPLGHARLPRSQTAHLPLNLSDHQVHKRRCPNNLRRRCGPKIQNVSAHTAPLTAATCNLPSDGGLRAGGQIRPEATASFGACNMRMIPVLTSLFVLGLFLYAFISF